MALFRFRPLAAASVTLIFAAVLLFLLPLWSAAVLAGVCLTLIAVIIILSHKKAFSPRRFLCLMLCCGALLGICRVLPQKTAENRMATCLDQEADVRLRVEEVTASNTYATRARVRVLTFGGRTRRVTAVLECGGEAALAPGQIVTGRVMVQSLTAAERYSGEAAALRGDGACVYLTEVGALTVEKEGSPSLRRRMNDLGLALAARVRTHVGDKEGNLVGALLFGDRAPLDDVTRRDFRRAGISHLLAISGLHIGILAAAFDRLLLLFRVNKTARGAVVLGLMGLYLLLTDCGFSILRAVLMAAGVYLCYLARGDGDPLTTLCFVGAAIVLLMPHAVFSVSYQLTMCATFGILAFEEARGAVISRLPHVKKGIGRRACALLRAAVSSVLVTLSASFAVLPVTYFVFDSFSWLTPFSNLVTVPLASLLLVFGSVSLLPSHLLALPAKWCAGWMLHFIGVCSELRCLVSFRMPFVPYLLAACVVFCLVLMLMRFKKHKWLAYLPIAVIALGFLIGTPLTGAAARNTLTGVYLHRGKNDGFALYGQGRAMILDLSNGSATRLYDDFAALSDLGATEVEVLCYTHYHAATPAAFADFADREKVRALWCPATETTEERDVLIALLGEAAARHIHVTIYERETPLTVFGDGTLTLSRLLYENRSVEPVWHATLSFGQNTLTLATVAESEYLRHAEGEEQPGGDTVILTAHGPVPHEAVTVPAGTACLVIPDDKALALLQTAPDTMYIDRPARYVFYMKK